MKSRERPPYRIGARPGFTTDPFPTRGIFTGQGAVID
jgi:hypothetical protein